MKKTILLFAVLTLFLFGCTKKSPLPIDTNIVQPTINQPVTDNNVEPVDSVADDQYKKMCGWINEADIIIKVNFAEGVVKDSSYETGFYYNRITSNMRLARQACDYRVGFKYNEVPEGSTVEVGVRGYSDSKRRTIAGQPISVTFDTNGVPDIGTNIEVTITD